MKKMSEVSRAEKMAYRISLIQNSVDTISTDLYFDGKLSSDGKAIVKDNKRLYRMIKKNKGYVYEG